MRKKMSVSVNSRFLFTVIFITASITFIAVESIIGLSAFRISTRLNEQYLSELSYRVFEVTENLFATTKSTAEYLNYSVLIRDFMICEDDQELISLSKRVKEFLNTMTLVENDIDSIVLYRTNHRVPIYSKTAPTIQERMLWESWRPQLEGSRPQEGFVHLNDSSSDDSYIGYVTDVICVEKGKYYGQTIGSILVIISPTMLNNFLSIPVIDQKSSVSIIDQDSNIIFSSFPASAESTAVSSGVYTPSDSRAFRRNILDTGWSMICTLTLSQQRSSMLRTFLSSLIWLIVILILLSMLYSFILNKLFIHPIENIFHDIQVMNRSAIPYPIKINSIIREVKEIVLAINTLNDMQDKAKQDLLQAQQRMFDVEIAKKANDLYLLENQVNPHFMRNTLQCISGLSITYNVPLINDIVDGLTEIYEYSLHEHGVVKLQEEIRIVTEYMKIVNIRYKDRFVCEIHVPQELSNFFIPKMTLQPLVENAVYHGLRNTGTRVQIDAYMEKERLYITIADNGKGIPSTQLQELISKLNDPQAREEATANRQVGLVNIYRRMLLYSEQCSMHVDSHEGNGTTITLAFPLISEYP